MTQAPILIDGVEVALRPSARTRRFVLRVEKGTGAARLSAPLGASRAAAERFLRANKAWLLERAAAAPGPVPFAAGEVVPLRGRPHLLKADPFRRSGPILASAEALHVPTQEPEDFRRRVEAWLKAEARRDLLAAAETHATALGVSFKRLTLRDARTRWGSCAANGDLSFSWRLILAPPSVLDYLAAHETAHLVAFDHGPRFWELVRRLRPDHEEAEDWLKAHGPELHRYGRGQGPIQAPLQERGGREPGAPAASRARPRSA